VQRLNDADDRGVVATMVAVLMAALIAVLAIVADVGLLYAERRQLQNGADAAVLAVALDCPTPGGCGTKRPLAESYADANVSKRGSTERLLLDANGFCGQGGGLPSCPTTTGMGPWDCRPVPSGPLAANYVQVRTETEVGGGNLLPAGFSRIFGMASIGPVRACARASWGGPSGLRAQLPLGISLCEFQKQSPVMPPFTAEMEKIVYFHGKASPCKTSSSGSDLPGGFGWLNTNEDCQATTDTSGWVADKTGASAPNSCSNAELQSLVGQIVNVPIFDMTNGLSGSNGRYHIVGYAAFYLTGYRFPSSTPVKSILTGQQPCGGSDSCISGVFTIDPTPTSGTVGGPSMGVTVVQMSG
jgi:hypothetical protein